MWDDEPNQRAGRTRSDRAPKGQDARRDCGLGTAVTWQPGRTTDPLRNTGCHCHGDPPQLNGPYLTWTRKVDNNSVTSTLDPEQAERLRPLQDNSRRLRELASEFEALALRQVENDPAKPDS